MIDTFGEGWIGGNILNSLFELIYENRVDKPGEEYSQGIEELKRR